ncbi:hypothetical protein Leryth_005744, partial [Lithospermum erythrorhizon]
FKLDKFLKFHSKFLDNNFQLRSQLKHQSMVKVRLGCRAKLKCLDDVRKLLDAAIYLMLEMQ